MLDDQIRRRLAAAVEKDGRSLRVISMAAGLNESFASQLLRTGREPGIGQFKALCDELGVTMGSMIFGTDVTPKEEEIARLIAQLSDDNLELVEGLVRKLSRPDAP